jgi:hypothetical protein
MSDPIYEAIVLMGDTAAKCEEQADMRLTMAIARSDGKNSRETLQKYMEACIVEQELIYRGKVESSWV